MAERLVDGIGALAGLQELYLAFNELRDVGPLALHENLQILDLDSNRYLAAKVVDKKLTEFRFVLDMSVFNQHRRAAGLEPLDW